MTNRYKLITIPLFISVLLCGCRMLPPKDKALLAGETPRAEEAVPTVTIEAAPPATPAPVAITTKKTPAMPSAEGNSKPRISYIVSEGELLWAIAKRSDVYNDPLLWPLLYQANRDQIKDPRKIYAGQALSIPRNVSEEEREKARNYAKKSDFFSPE
jgi:nucleoid-associated protein YgaU